MNFQVYRRLYGQYINDDTDDYIFCEHLETRSQTFNWHIKPHVHPGIYQVFLIEEGSVLLSTDRSQEKLEAPCVILIPVSVLHGFEYQTGTKGRIVSLDNRKTDTILKDFKLKTSFFDHLQHIDLRDDDKMLRQLLSILDSLEEEQLNSYPEKENMIRALLVAFFTRIFRAWLLKNSEEISTEPNSLHYFRRFMQLLRNSNKKDNVTDLAKEIGISTAHLNRICNQIAHKSAGMLIDEYLIEEAKYLLANDQLSITEIAYDLNFEYPNYFARFFRKYVGMSPTEYREEKRITPETT